MQPLTLEQLRAMPTIQAGPVNDLKVDTGSVRVWVRRDDKGNGAPMITVVMREHGTWSKIGEFNDRLSVPCQRLVDR